MPYYYSVVRTPGTPGTLLTTNGTPNTLSTHFRFLTVANQQMARIMGMFFNARFNTAGGALGMLIRGGAAGSGGTANTPVSKKGTLNRAADTTAFDDTSVITAGTTPILQQTVGFAQTGGQGGWVALELDDSYQMAPGGGAQGNLEVGSKAATASVSFDATINMQEG